MSLPVPEGSAEKILEITGQIQNAILINSEVEYKKATKRLEKILKANE